MKNKVYAVSPDFTNTTWAEACQKTAFLDTAVQWLAGGAREEIHMHQWKNPAEGAPVVLVECSETFLEKIKRLPGFHSAEPACAETIRRSETPQVEAPEAMTPKRKGPKTPGA